MKPLSLLAAPLCALLLAACGDDGGGASVGGGGSSDEAQVRGVVDRYMQAFVDGDTEEACDLLTPAARKELEEAFELLDAKSCAEAMSSVLKMLEEKDRKQLEDIEIRTVKVTGDTAVVTTTGPEDEPTRLRKVDGEWRVEGDDAPSGTETARTVTPPPSADAEAVEPEDPAVDDAAAAASQQTANVGEPLRQNGYTVTVVKVRKAKRLPGTEFTDPVSADGRFVILTLRVRNGGKEVAMYDSSLVELVDADGTVYSSRTGGGEEQVMALPDYLTQREIQPKTSETGDVAFDVPVSADVAKAQFTDTLDLFTDDFTGAVHLR